MIDMYEIKHNGSCNVDKELTVVNNIPEIGDIVPKADVSELSIFHW